MDPRPTPGEAARALREVDRRRAQARRSVHGPGWLEVFFALVIFTFLSSTDFFPAARVWGPPILAVLVVGYVVLLRTRRGSAWLGQSARLHPQAIPARRRWIALTVVIAAWVLSLVFVFAQVHVGAPVHYFGTIVGAVLAVALIVIGWDRRRRARTGLSENVDGADRDD